ncbi:MAG TPA: AlpA family phage regulatory protein [Nitrococcus sp.]|nr:AlpA family phage regulatory protein [Nitrococcus sp.]
MPKQRNVTQLYLSDRDLAIRYGVNRASIWRWTASGDLPEPVRLGGRTTRWRLADIEAHEAQSAGDAA